MKVGLVLGAGGVLGGAWLTGGLHALARETDWDPAGAECIVGTSAGSMIGALVAAGVAPWFMVAHSSGESFDGIARADGRPAAEADRAVGAVFRLHRGLPALGPGSLRMALTALTDPLRHTPLQLLAGWLSQVRRLLRDLPQGEPHKIRRPAGPPASWPPLRPVRGAA
jgi:NTE family protein